MRTPPSPGKGHDLQKPGRAAHLHPLAALGHGLGGRAGLQAIPVEDHCAALHCLRQERVSERERVCEREGERSRYRLRPTERVSEREREKERERERGGGRGALPANPAGRRARQQSRLSSSSRDRRRGLR